MAAMAAPDAVKDPVAEETLVVFAKTCLVTLGAPEKVAEKTTEFGATKLSSQAALEVNHNKPGSQAWRLTTPHGAQLAITSTPDRQCSVLVRRADAQALQDGVLLLLDKLEASSAMKYKPEHHDKTKRPGGSENTSDYLMTMPQDQDASVSVTTTTIPTADLQGLLTLTMLSKKN